MSSLVILTGAGISAESGIKTFRDHNGLWENHRIEDVASPKGFERDPAMVHAFYNARRAQLNDVKPNAAHIALARLERAWKGEFLLVTQNVDDLHERGGSEKLVHMHGELFKSRCVKTGRVFDWRRDVTIETRCPCCELQGALRPHIVWFSEMPLELDRIYEHLARASLFVAIGTSGQVYPAAGFVSEVPDETRRVEINAEKSMMSHAFQEHRLGPAATEVVRFVDELLG